MVNGRDPLLSPSAALTLFNPAQGVISGIQPVERKRVRYGFRISNIGVLIQQDTTSEVMEEPAIYPLPTVPYWLVGLINLRGNLVPVFNLKLALGLQESQERRWLIVLGRGDGAVGVFIDDLPQIVETEKPLERLPPLPVVMRPYIARAYHHDGMIWAEFDHQGFFRALSSQ